MSDFSIGRQPPIFNISQVAITLVYRYHAGARVPIDAGNPVADNGKVDGYRFMYPLVILTFLFIITSSISTLDKRLIQAKRAGDIPVDEPMLPSWTGLIIFIHYGIMIIILLLNWKYALLIFVVGFLFEVLPVWEIIGNILTRPFKPSPKKDKHKLPPTPTVA